MDRDKLLELALRCEAATGADREIDVEIEARKIDAKTGLADCSFPTVEKWVAAALQYGWNVPRYTASLDAAMTLVPEGWTVANLSQSDTKGWWAELRQGLLSSYDKVVFGKQLNNATPALALCAASLRALAEGQNDG